MNAQALDDASEPRGANEHLSALADGRAEACDAALSHWAADPEARSTWHRYQLIGDVLRSDDLASTASHDEGFLQAFRQRLEAEPTVIAPVAASPGSVKGAGGPSRRWAVAAAAAGVLVVGGVVLSLRGLAGGDATQLAQAGGPRAGDTVPQVARTRVLAESGGAVAVPVAGAIGADPQWRVLDGQVIRDARLDAYLWAHRGHSAVSGRFQTVVLER